MAGPDVFFRIADHLRPDRVQMNVADQGQKITVGINQQSLVPPLKEMAGAPVLSVYELGISKSDILHDAGERDSPNLDCQMEMRRHQAKGMSAILEAFNAFLQQQEKTRTVAGIEDDVLPAVAAKNDVINGSGVMKSRFACHDTRAE